MLGECEVHPGCDHRRCGLLVLLGWEREVLVGNIKRIRGKRDKR